MAGKMRSFRFDDEQAWSAAQTRAKAESRAFGDVLGDLIRAYAAGDAPAASPEAVMTAAPVVMTEAAGKPAVMTTPPRPERAPGDCGHGYPDRKATFGEWHCRKCNY